MRTKQSKRTKFAGFIECEHCGHDDVRIYRHVDDYGFYWLCEPCLNELGYFLGVDDATN